MGVRVIRGDVFLAEVGGKRRPVVVLTRSAVLDVRHLVTVAEVTTVARGLAVEVPLPHEDIGLDQPSFVNCDGLHTVRQTTLTHKVGSLPDRTMTDVCWAVGVALGCT